MINSTASTSLSTTLTQAELEAYHRDGFYIARGVASAERMHALREHFMALHHLGAVPGRYDESEAPISSYPRMMQPHRWDELARRHLLDPCIFAILRDLLEDEPLAAQSMFYYKPPGSAGQGFHQDNFYLKARPATCMAAWLAVDDADANNGGLFVVPGSHIGDIVCPESGGVSMWGTIAWVPDEAKQIEVRLRSGDCLFFNGSLIHGSRRNESTERWRRSFICHFIGRDRCEQVGAYYRPLFAADGSRVDKRFIEEGISPCGGLPR